MGGGSITQQTDRTFSDRDLALVRVHLASGMDLHQLAVEMGITVNDARVASQLVLDEVGHDLGGRRREDVYSDYVMRTRHHIEQLQEIMVDLRGGNQGSALVGAVLAKQKLIEGMIKVGQDLGIVDRKPVRTEHAVLMHMDDPALAEMLSNELEGIKELMQRGGGQHFLDVQVAGVGQVKMHDLDRPGLPTPRATAPAGSPIPQPPATVVRRKIVSRPGDLAVVEATVDG